MGVKKYNRLKKFMQVEVDVKCMHTNLVGVAPSVSEIRLLFFSLQKRPKFPFRPWAIVHGGQKIELAQKIHASRGWREMHANQFWLAWPLQFWRHGNLLNLAKFPFQTMGLYSPTMGSKNYTSRGWCEISYYESQWWSENTSESLKRRREREKRQYSYFLKPWQLANYCNIIFLITSEQNSARTRKMPTELQK